MGNELTIEMFLEAYEKTKTKCELCNTEATWLVAGYEGLFCDCMKEKLCKTKHAKETQKYMRELVRL